MLRGTNCSMQMSAKRASFYDQPIDFSYVPNYAPAKSLNHKGKFPLEND